MRTLKILIFCLFCSMSYGQSIQQQVIRVLFLGNSYTAVNNLPQVVHDVAMSAGDSISFDSNTPGGYTFQMHSVDATSVSKIQAGGWDFVVLQEQSQLPSFPISQVQTDCYPYAHYLDSVIHVYSPCAQTTFYMTWGRKNGDASNCATWPPVCTYSGMDSLLRLRYMAMANDNQALVSPVGAVRHYIRDHYPLIELYQSDESHPTEAGTYAAACCFYALLYRKDPSLITYNYTLSGTDAANIRNAAKLVAYDSLLTWHAGAYDPLANFSYSTVSGNQLIFNNQSSHATKYNWYFGDGDSSNLVNPTHSYLMPGTYDVMLIAINCGMSDTIIISIYAGPAAIPEVDPHDTRVVVYPNPAHDYLKISIPDNLPAEITFYDLTSRIVLEDDFNKPTVLNIGTLKPGIYFYRINGRNCVYRYGKLVKE